MSHFQHHVFFCCNQRAPGERDCCADKGAARVRDYAKKRVKELGLSVAVDNKPAQVRVNLAGCMERCELGPVIAVYPQGVWYCYVDEDDVEEIIQSHLINGKPVERLRLADGAL